MRAGLRGSSYITGVPLVVPAILLVLGLIFFLVLNADITTLTLRFSLNFFNLFTVIPLSIISFGSIIVYYALKDRKRMKSKFAMHGMIDAGTIFILLGFGMFYLDIFD